MKILGGLLILLSSIVCTYYYESHLKDKVNKYNELISFISHISNQIEYFSCPLEQIYEKYTKKTPFISSLIIKKCSFDKKVDKLVINFFQTIGQGFKKEQIKLCSYTINELESSLSSLKLLLPNKIKVFRSMSLFVGICTIILV
ncbi:MAG: hypothetical protein IJD89_03300, partial [Clostridia bacterium]|nr:hypothetical protein [Clostridia bacterium]